mmetsp:Transcript_12022/g.25844  ORF Transcript_12022/g.25844 Transcript_12022/m.25844 type:complete len:116 (+) Transcript_12022:279-626(+)
MILDISFLEQMVQKSSTGAQHSIQQRVKSIAHNDIKTVLNNYTSILLTRSPESFNSPVLKKWKNLACKSMLGCLPFKLGINFSTFCLVITLLLRSLKLCWHLFAIRSHSCTNIDS